MRKVLIVLVLVLATLAMLAGPAGAIVHVFTPVDQCANSPNAGGPAAIGSNPNFDPGAPAPIPVTASDGKTQGQGDSAPVEC